MKSTTIKTLLRALLIGISLLSLNTQAGIKITYIHNDALGTSVAGTDEQGNVKWRAHYQPYGVELLGERQLFGVRTGYTGHRDDPETGLTYMGARYYSPMLGRFMGVDPAGVNEANIYSFNRYVYANNNPYKYIDPDGKAVVQAVRGSLWAGARIGALINVGTQRAFGASLGILIFDALHNENADNDGESEKEVGKSGRKITKRGDRTANPDEPEIAEESLGDAQSKLGKNRKQNSRFQDEFGEGTARPKKQTSIESGKKTSQNADFKRKR